MTPSLRTKNAIRVGVALGVAACVAGCSLRNGTLRATPPAGDLETQAREAKQDYVIGPRDELMISVWNQPELSVAKLVVRLDGKLSFPLLDDVEAAGRTALELKAVITERLEEYVTAPHVTVIVTQINSKLVYLIGEVSREGPIVYQSEMRVIDALSTAGGFNPFAGKKRVKIIRDRNGDTPIEFVFNYEDFVKGKDLEQNILLLPGDRIVVPPERSLPW